MEDVVIVGGGFAGLSAALQLGRARRRVLVLDTGLPRNRFAAEAHGALGHDGRPPREILDLGRDEMRTYTSVRIEQTAALAASAEGEGFAVTLAGGGKVATRRIILAHGVTDQLPEIAGFAECWGRSVIHCPYCHGFEFADQRLGVVVATLDGVLHRARHLRDWSERLTVFTNGLAPAADDAQRLADLGVGIERAPIMGLQQAGGRLEAVETTEGRIALDALFWPPPVRFSSRIGEQLGCATAAGFVGPYFEVGAMQETSVPGVFAAGDIARAMHSVPLAMSAGSLAGAAAHQSLL